MSFTAEDVLFHARDLHGVLSEQNAPAPLAYRQIGRDVEDCYRALTHRVPGFLGATLSIPFPLADFAAGVDLSTLLPDGWGDLIRGTVVYPDVPGSRGVVEARFVPLETDTRNWAPPAFTVQGDTLRFLGVERDYAGFSRFDLLYTPLPLAPTGPAAVIPLPHDARDFLATKLAAFFLMRLVGEPAYRVTADMAVAMSSKAAAQADEFYARVSRLKQRQTYVVKEEW